jgi:hypothetical protein
MKLFLAAVILINSIPIAAPARTQTRPVRVASALILLPQESPSPTPTPSPTPDAELEAAQRETKLAEEKKKKEVAEKEEAEARAAKLKATVQPFGAPNNISIPTGSVTTDQSGWAESHMLAQEAARLITQRLTGFLCGQPKYVAGVGAPIKTVVIYNASDIAGLELYDSIIFQMEGLNREFAQKHKETEALLIDTNPTRALAVSDAGVESDPALAAAFAIPGIATGLVKSVAELINLFRTDTKFENQTIAVTEDMVVSYLADQLSGDSQEKQCADGFYIYYPLYMPPLPPRGVDGHDDCPAGAQKLEVALSALGASLSTARDDVRAIEGRIELLTKLGANADERKKNDAAQKEKQEQLAKPKLGKDEKEKLTKEINELGDKNVELNKKFKALVTDFLKSVMGKNPTDEQVASAGKIANDNVPKYAGWIKKLNELKSRTEQLIAATEQVTTKLNTPDEANKLTPLARLRRAERLHCILETNDTYTLRVAVTANGTTKIKKNLFVDAKVRHAAGATLVYQLFDKFGRVAKGSTLQCYIDYQSSEDVRMVVSGEKTATCRSSTPNPNPHKPDAKPDPKGGNGKTGGSGAQ